MFFSVYVIYSFLYMLNFFIYSFLYMFTFFICSFLQMFIFFICFFPFMFIFFFIMFIFFFQDSVTFASESTALLLLQLNFIEPLLCLEKVFKGFIIHDRNLQISRV